MLSFTLPEIDTAMSAPSAVEHDDAEGIAARARRIAARARRIAARARRISS